MRRLLSILLLTGCATTAGTRSVPAGQGSIHVDDGGHGTALPVIFVHGNGANLTQWRAQLEHVRRSRRAIAFDLPGMGLSDPPKDGNVSVDRFADSIGAVADALRVKRFVLVGHSYGGSVSMAYAAKHPERVAGLVLADAAGHVQMSDEGATKFQAALRKNKDGVVAQWFASILVNAREETKTAVLTSVHATPVEVFGGALEGLRSFDPAVALAAYHGPRLVIAATSTEGPSSLHRQFADLAVERIDGVSHWLMMDKPEQFDEILDRFLARVE